MPNNYNYLPDNKQVHNKPRPIPRKPDYFNSGNALIYPDVIVDYHYPDNYPDRERISHNWTKDTNAPLGAAVGALAYLFHNACSNSYGYYDDQRQYVSLENEPLREYDVNTHCTEFRYVVLVERYELDGETRTNHSVKAVYRRSC